MCDPLMVQFIVKVNGYSKETTEAVNWAFSINTQAFVLIMLLMRL